jgi:heme-degrading monooxygenase HmoA
MFARNVSVHLKSNMLSEYGHVFESQVLPLLRRQKGFRDEISIASSNGLDVTAISLWDNKADAEAYNTSAYPEVVKSFSKVIDGTPQVQTCEVVNSTFHKIAVPVHA